MRFITPPRALLPGLACLTLMFAAGCSTVLGGSCHKPQPYASAENLPPLRVPAGMTGPEIDEAMAIPALAEPEVPVDKEGPCLEAPPAITAPPLPPSGITDPPVRRPGDRRRDREEAAPQPPPDSGAESEPEPDSGSDRPRRRPTLPR